MCIRDRYIAENTSLNIHGIMFSAILIASLGAVMDVAMSISSSIFEINDINDTLNKRGLFKSGMNIGKEMCIRDRAITVLVVATVIIAIESEFLVGAVEPMTETLGLSKLFVGIILIPIIGNAAEHSTAIIMAMKNKMDVSVEIAIGSSLQVILFVAPVLIFLSLIFKPMSIIFNAFELVALIVSVLIANRIVNDGESNWLEGVQLLAVYIIIAAMFMIV